VKKPLFDSSLWTRILTGTPVKGMHSAVPPAPGPTVDDVVLPLVTWVRASGDYQREDNPPPWVGDPVTWERAQRVVWGAWGEYIEPYAAVLAVYLATGGRVISR
jgi:hypothetical protein